MTHEKKYNEIFERLTPKKNPPVLVYEIPKIAKELKEFGTSTSEFAKWIYNDTEMKNKFLSDPYFTANLMNTMEDDSVISTIKSDVKKNASESKYEYIFDAANFLVKTTKEELENEKPKVYPLLPDKALDVIIDAQKKEKFITIIAGDPKTGAAWGEINDIKGIVGTATFGAAHKAALFVSFASDIRDEDTNKVIRKGYENLNGMTNNDIFKYLKDNELEIEDVLDDGGMPLSDSIVAIKVGFRNTKPAYKHENFTPCYDISNGKIEVDEFTVRNKKTGEDAGRTRDFKEYKLFALETKTGETTLISTTSSLEDIEKIIAFEYETSLLNPSDVNIKDFLSRGQDSGIQSLLEDQETEIDASVSIKQ